MKACRIASLLIVALVVASCANTIRGVGRDINASADAVEDSIGG